MLKRENGDYIIYMKYPSDMFVSASSPACFDKARNLLFIYRYQSDWDYRSRFMVINMEREQHSLTEILPYSAIGEYIVGTKDEIHIIGGYYKNLHHIFNKQSRKTELIHTFKEFQSMHGISLVHIESLNVILLIGGSNHGKNINCQRFCLQSRKWKNTKNFKLPYYGEQALLTKDEKYVIVPIRFQNIHGTHDYVYIIDIINKDMYKLGES